MRSKLLALSRSCALILAAAAPLACISPDPEQAALALHRNAIVIDTHSDTTGWLSVPGWRFDERHRSDENHMDLPRIREGGLDVQFWSIWMGKREGDGRAIREALEHIDAVREMVDRYPDDIVLAGSVAEIRRAVARGKFVSVMGVEGGHIIEENLAALRSFYRLGVRYMTLTHSFNTTWADSSGTREVPEPEHHGLSPFGEDVVHEMNRIGMMVDVSHVSDETFWDVLRVTRAPVIASHSSCKAIADHTRNMSDDMLRGLAENDGVIMINFYPAYIDEQASADTSAYFKEWGEKLGEMRKRLEDDRAKLQEERRKHYAAHPVPRSPLSVLLDHFDHAIALAGPDHVGIGADWDGVPSMPEGMEDVSRLPALTLGLLERGHSKETVRKVLGENLLRVMERVEELAGDSQGPVASAAQEPLAQ